MLHNVVYKFFFVLLFLGLKLIVVCREFNFASYQKKSLLFRVISPIGYSQKKKCPKTFAPNWYERFVQSRGNLN